ncbi:MAG: Hpt domain-containing protein [Roseburia sp.]|nr:Hpt domain-containing protein [Roseburia sp.]
MTLKECYAALGGSYDEVLGRLCSERLVQRFVLKFLSDGSYDLLCRSMEEGNMEEAFRAAHTIKGVCSNLAFNTLLDSSSRLTEVLRAGGGPEADGLFAQVQADYQRTLQAIQAFQEGVAG